MPVLDTVLITASSEPVASAFRRLLDLRLERGLYPREIAFEVVADPPGGRVGTGGSTLWALRRLLARSGGDPATFFADRRIALVHAGGESRRLPAYAPEGKLFAPLPLAASSLLPPVVLDAQLGLFLRYPWRRGEILVASGDAVVDFDPAAIPPERAAVHGFAIPAPVEQGARHGVFCFDSRLERVVDYRQKATPDDLRRGALIEGTAECALDIGLVAIDAATAAATAALGDATADGESILGGLEAGRVRFDLYLEVLTACLPGLTFEAFRDRIAGRSTTSAEVARRIFEVFGGRGLGGSLVREAVFEHVGSLAEFPGAARDLLTRRVTPFFEPEAGELRPEVTRGLVVHNSIDTEVRVTGTSAALVDGCARSSLVLAGNNLVVGLEDRHLAFELPDGFVLDERHLPEGPVTLVLSAADSLKEVAAPGDLVFCGRPLDAWLAERGLGRADVFEGAASAATDLHAARLFWVGAADDDLRGYLEPPGPAWSARFRAADRRSLAGIAAIDDAVGRSARWEALRRTALQRQVARGEGWRSIGLADMLAAFPAGDWQSTLERLLGATDDALLRAYRARTLGAVAGRPVRDLPPAAIDYLGGDAAPGPLAVALKEDQIVWSRAPVRLDLAGGWTDTPPYTLRFGGRVTNVAVDLNGQPPIQAFCRRVRERHLRVHSIDLGVTETYTGFEQLRAFRDPASPFALPRAALSLVLGAGDGAGAEPGSEAGSEASLEAGGVGSRGRDLAAVFDALGGGLELTVLCAVPKGSGLGTSSILGGVILAALGRFLGRAPGEDQLIRQVLQVEQMLTTGGGWQDQIGGLVPGVKYIESRPGIRPRPVLHQLDPFLFGDPAGHACFTLFYTGITRLARNILADVVDRVNGAEPAYLFTLRRLGLLALDAKRSIERRDLVGLGGVLADAWQANRRIHPSTTNAEVEAIFGAVGPHVLGAKLLGAGGGGYALLLSPTPREADLAREILRREFEGGRARLVDLALSPRGLETSVS